MDSPVRQYLKQKDYRRHKLFRKIRRRQAAERQLAINEPIRQLKRKLKRYDGGKDVNANNVFDFIENGEDIRKAFERMYGNDAGRVFYDLAYNSNLRDDTFLAGTLPEVTVTPTFDTDIARLKILRMIPDKKLRLSVLERLNPMKYQENGEYVNTQPSRQYDEYKTINRLYDIWNASKLPTIRREGDIIDPVFLKFAARGGYRDHYYPVLNNAHLNRNRPALIDELSHAYQYNAKGLNFNPSLFSLPGDIKINGHTGYNRPGHPEYEAHSIILPVLEAYINGNLNSLDEVNTIINDIQNNQDYYKLASRRYDRIHLNEKSEDISNFNSGKDSGIHIKPENRGKFTALKKRTGKSASWFKAHGTPALKKMATFALNARKWKHK